MRTWVRKSNFNKETNRVNNKYNFTHHLREVGDWVETFPMTMLERRQIYKAAHIWAYRKGYTIGVETVGMPGGLGIRLTLEKKYK